MQTSRRIVVATFSVAVAIGTAGLFGPAQAADNHSTAKGAAAPAALAPAVTQAHNVCARVPHQMHCLSVVAAATAANRVHPDAGAPSGYFPSDLRSAYNLPSATKGVGQTVAIVDAFDDPSAEADMGVYRAQFGIPACTTANGCFRKVNQTGGTTYPAANGGWAQEISLDLDMVSAICPNCHILLVEANKPTTTSLGKSVNEAAKLHANAISNSYGGSDTSDTAAPYYNHAGIAITASSGDSGFGVEFPASSHYVTAVGGTSLVHAGNTRGWSETVWSGAGSGCSTLNAALTSQANFNTGCAKRAVADVSAVADPNTGVAVYDSFASGGLSGWLVFGGTSVASPIIASVFALAGNEASIANNYPYKHDTAANLNDVTLGSNGACSPLQLCTARVGWDGPTGLGTPNGTGAF